MKKLSIILLLATLIPCASFADDPAENGASFSFKSFLNNLASRTKNTVTGSATDRANSLVNRLTNGFNGGSNYQTVPMQNMYGNQMQDRSAREDIVRCMYLGKLVEIQTGLAEQDADAQIKSKRAGELYATLKCNEQLADYQDVWKRVDSTIGTCFNNDDCQTLNPKGKSIYGKVPTGTSGTYRLPTINTGSTVPVQGRLPTQ